jgi:hypothetical protein
MASGVGGAGGDWIAQANGTRSSSYYMPEPIVTLRKRLHLLKPNLKDLQLGEADWADLDTDIEFISKKCPNLKTLHLSNLRDITRIGKDFNFPRLEFLHVSQCPKLDKFKIRAPLLQKLELFDNPALKKIKVRVQFSAEILVRTPFEKMDINRKSLENFDLEQIQDAQAGSLDLSYCDEVTNAGLRHLIQLPLKKLSLRGCHRVGNRGLSYLWDGPIHFPMLNLETLDLGGLPKFTLLDFFPVKLKLEEGYSIGAERPPIKLKHLDLSDNPQLLDSHFKSWEKRESQWNCITLSISNCSSLTALAFVHFGGLKSLQVLRADNLPLLTDKGLEYLKSLLLERLSIAKCKKITDAGLKQLKAIKSLKILNVKGCPLVTIQGILSLEKAVPGIKIYND